MMTHSFTCDEFAEHLAAFLEHEVDEPTRAALESHARRCTACGTVLADVRELTVAAKALPELAPARDLWSGIAARIEAPVLPLDAADTTATTDRARGWMGGLGGRRTRWAMLSAAAAALVAISVSTTYLAMRGPAGAGARQVASSTAPVTPAPVTGRAPAPLTTVAVAPTPPLATSGAAPAPAVQAPDAVSRTPARSRTTARFASTAARKATAEETYGREIATLRAVVARRRSTLDTATVAVIEKNLAVIDSAIAQCRAALAKDPASGFLLQSLNSALETKVELLRTAAMLPAHT